MEFRQQTGRNGSWNDNANGAMDAVSSAPVQLPLRRGLGLTVMAPHLRPRRNGRTEGRIAIQSAPHLQNGPAIIGHHAARVTRSSAAGKSGGLLLLLFLIHQPLKDSLFMPLRPNQSVGYPPLLTQPSCL